MARSVELSRPSPEPSPAHSSSAPSSPNCRPAIRAINPSPVKPRPPATASTVSLPAPQRSPPDYPSLASLNRDLPSSRPPSRALRHARSLSSTIAYSLSSRYRASERAARPASPASDVATRASSSPPPPPPRPQADLPRASMPFMDRLAARFFKPPLSSQARQSKATPTLQPGSPRPAVKGRKKLARLLRRRTPKPQKAVLASVPERVTLATQTDMPDPAWVDEDDEGRAPHAGAHAAVTPGRETRKRPRVSGGSARSRIAKEEVEEGVKGRGVGEGSSTAKAATYYASLSASRRSPALALARPVLAHSSSKKRRLPAHSPASLRKVINRPRPVARRASEVAPFGPAGGWGEEPLAAGWRRASQGSWRSVARERVTEGVDEFGYTAEEVAVAEFDDGDQAFEDVESAFDDAEVALEHLVSRSFSRSSAPSPASSRFVRRSRPAKATVPSSLALDGGDPIHVDRPPQAVPRSPVWYAAPTGRSTHPDAATGASRAARPTSHSSRPHSFSSRPASTASSATSSATHSRTSTSDASAQDVASAEVVTSLTRHRLSGETAVPRLGSLSPVSPFKPDLPLLLARSGLAAFSSPPGQAGAGSPCPPEGRRDAGCGEEARDGRRGTDSPLALAGTSAAFPLAADDPAARARVQRAAELVFGGGGPGSAAGARPAPLWGAERTAYARAASAAGRDCPGSPDSACTVRPGAGGAIVQPHPHPLTPSVAGAGAARKGAARGRDESPWRALRERQV